MQDERNPFSVIEEGRRGGASGRAPSQVPQQQVRLALARILASSGFANSERMRRFLRLVVERALAGQSAALKEYLVGIEVFDRPESFDPRTDPIVRVEARRLREKLKRYYESEGRGDAVIVEFPKGKYVPVFRRREHPIAADAAPAGMSRRIAVLPFANLSSDPDNEYFSEGLTQELTHALTKVPELCVIAPSSTIAARNRNVDVQEIGRHLNVTAVLQGSVRRSGDRLRITAQLLDVAHGTFLWSESFERRMEDVFAIQDEISCAIVQTLRIRLVGPIVRDRENVTAYNLYLKGRFYGNRRTQDGLLRGVDFFRQALEEQPDYALAYAGLADAYTLLSQYGMLAPREVMPKALAAAKRALELDDTLAEAEASMAFARTLYCWEWQQAEENYRRAIELNPGYVNARHWYALDFLAPLARFDEALVHMEHALQLDPLSPNLYAGLGSLYIARREYDRAEEECRRALDLEPHFYKAHMSLGRVYVTKGDYRRGIDEFLKAASLVEPPYATAALGHAYALAGDREQATRRLEELMRWSKTQCVLPTSVALVYIGLGDHSRALDWLERAYAERSGPLIWVGHYPVYDPLREEPRFQRILERIGLRPPAAGAA